jgi:hypothetical protein
MIRNDYVTGITRVAWSLSFITKRNGAALRPLGSVGHYRPSDVGEFGDDAVDLSDRVLDDTVKSARILLRHRGVVPMRVLRAQ